MGFDAWLLTQFLLWSISMNSALVSFVLWKCDSCRDGDVRRARVTVLRRRETMANIFVISVAAFALTSWLFILR